MFGFVGKQGEKAKTEVKKTKKQKKQYYDVPGSSNIKWTPPKRSAA